MKEKTKTKITFTENSGFCSFAETQSKYIDTKNTAINNQTIGLIGSLKSHIPITHGTNIPAFPAAEDKTIVPFCKAYTSSNLQKASDNPDTVAQNIVKTEILKLAPEISQSTIAETADRPHDTATARDLFLKVSG